MKSDNGGAHGRRRAEEHRVFVNGTIYRGGVSGARAEALAVVGEKIAHVGGFDECKAIAGSDAELIDLQGGTLMPSFTDAHVHPVEGFLFTSDADLAEAKTPQAVLEGIAACARNYPAREWVLVANVDLQLMDGLPGRAELDRIIPDRPLLVIGSDIHCGALNSVALRVLGVDRDTPDPPGGLFVRNSPGGEPSGIVHESALHRIFPMLPQLAPDGVRAAIRKGQQQAHRFGITGWFDAVVNEYLLLGYGESAARDELDVYVSAGLLASPHERVEAQIEKFQQWRARFDAGPLHLHTVKIFLDGTVEGATAALLEPYDDSGGNFEILWDRRQLFHMVALADRSGFDLHFHTVGDRAVRMALDAMAHVNAVCPYRDRRPHLCHLDLIHDDDVPRFGELGCIANIQSFWAPLYSRGAMESRLGKERMRRNYPFKSLRDSGAFLVGGSDWPVSTMDPLAAIRRGVTRALDRGAQAWLPEQRLELMTMLECYTTNAAWGLRFENDCGVLTAGKDASLAVLSGNLFRTPVDEITDIRVRQTYFKGRRVFGGQGWN